MKAIISFCILLVALPLFAGTVVSHDIDSPSIAKNAVGIKSLRHIEIYLPSGYDTSTDRYPVLYWIPGFGGSADGVTYKIALDKAIRNGVISPTIVVFIDVSDEIWLFHNSPLIGNWEDFMLSELVPFIDKTYRTIPNAQARGLMGHSSGGYSALLLPVLHPNVWGSIGLNDPAAFAMWYPIDEEADIQALNSDYASIKWAFIGMPKALDGYDAFTPYVKLLLQMGASFSPNSNSPILADMPRSKRGEWVQEIREKWSDYDLTNPKSISKYSAILKNLSSLTIIVPEIMAIENTNSVTNLYFIERLKTAGISVTRLDMPGDHGSDRPGRLVALAEQLLKSMPGAKR